MWVWWRNSARLTAATGSANPSREMESMINQLDGREDVLGIREWEWESMGIEVGRKKNEMKE